MNFPFSEDNLHAAVQFLDFTEDSPERTQNPESGTEDTFDFWGHSHLIFKALDFETQTQPFLQPTG